MTLVENVKFLDQVDARVVMTKADALRGRTFKPDKRRNHVAHFASILVAKSFARPRFQIILTLERILFDLK